MFDVHNQKSWSSTTYPQETNLIELEEPTTQPPAPSSDLNNCNVINITLNDLTGGEGFGFQVPKPKSLLDVIHYLDKCNEKHNQLMSQVATTRLQCQHVMYSM